MPTQADDTATERTTSKGLVSRLLSALHGDKYMVDAYPPQWQEHQVAHPTDTPSSPPPVGTGVK